MRITPELRKSLIHEVLNFRFGGLAKERLERCARALLKDPKLAAAVKIAKDLHEEGLTNYHRPVKNVRLRDSGSPMSDEALFYLREVGKEAYDVPRGLFQDLQIVLPSLPGYAEIAPELAKMVTLQKAIGRAKTALETQLNLFTDTADLVKNIPEMEGFLTAINPMAPPLIPEGDLKRMRSILAVYGGDHGD